MQIISTIRLVFQTLLARKGRSFLTILGIVIGVAGVIIIIALGAGAQSLILGQVTKLGSNLISVQPGKSNEKGPPAQVFGIVVTTLTAEDAEAIRDTSRVPNVLAVEAQVRGMGTLVWQNRDLDTNIVGAEHTNPQVVNYRMRSGRFFDEREGRGNANVAVLGSYVSEQLFENFGLDPIGQILKIKGEGVGIALRVIGVIEERGSAFFQNQDDQVYVPLEIVQKRFLGIRHVQMINIKVDSADNLGPVRQNIKQLLRERHKVKAEADEDFTVRNVADALEILTTITGAMRLFLTAMAAIALAVGGIGILNIMMMTVTERTREIGLRKAVGAGNGQIRSQFLLEAGIMTCVGGIIGIMSGVLAAYLVSVLMRFLDYDWAFVISPQSIVLSVGVSVLTGVIFGLYPAFKASRLDPIEALRYE